MGASHHDVRVADEVWTTAATSHRSRPGATDFAAGAPCTARDPILGLRGLGKEIWADEDADAYVRQQRQGWQ